jgi:hypothetical protein
VVPVSASTLRKKNNHLGPTVGIVKLIRAYRPPQPINARIKAAGMKDLTGGDDWELIWFPIIISKNKKTPGNQHIILVITGVLIKVMGL